MKTKVEKIEGNLENQILSGSLSKGDQIPSLNFIKTKNKVSRDTVVRAYKNLVHRGILTAKPGKGYFVSEENWTIKKNVFLFLDELSEYKNSLVKSIEANLGGKANCHIFFHHYNEVVFKNQIQAAIGNYTNYVISPFPNSKTVSEMLHLIPKNQLILIDRHDQQEDSYKFVGQEYKEDIVRCLNDLGENIKKYQDFQFIFPRNSFHPIELKEGFSDFCKGKAISFKIHSEFKNLKKGDAYLVIEDEDLALIVEKAKEKHLTLGKDIGLISYNETRLKALIANGITTISADFHEMGRHLASMIYATENIQIIHSGARLIKRNSF
ncbi:GntR family transcriptional regulator [Maribacter sp. 2210JD10-5]|uniref:GntR family transcriptional regulator n=1 Tax=Maribacter sp. 2210JD10-5 TaxID=3386272 RepID=UPI0039BD320B